MIRENASARVEIAKVAIDSSGRVIVVPACGDFSFIYRAGMGVHWHAETRALSSHVAKNKSSIDWFMQIVKAVDSEYGKHMFASPNTKWEDISDNDRAAFVAWLNVY